MKTHAIGIDVGGTSAKFGFVVRGEGIKKESSIPMIPRETSTEVIERIAEECVKYYKENEKHFSEKILIGMGMPGVISLDGGTVSYPPNFPTWTVVRLGDEMKRLVEQKTGKQAKVLVENDANLAALGECFYGTGKNFSDFVMITLGTGIGGGIIINNKIYRGTTGGAAEVGHFTIERNSSHIHAGIRGTMEGLIGWRQICKYALPLIQSRPNSVLNKIDFQEKELTSYDLYTAAKQKDKTALEVWQYVGEVLGVGIATLITILDIRKFIIGGGVAGAFEFFSPFVKETALNYLMKSMHDGIEILPAELGNKAGIIGSASLCLH